jgi:hypothetical protein
VDLNAWHGYIWGLCLIPTQRSLEVLIDTPTSWAAARVEREAARKSHGLPDGLSYKDPEEAMPDIILKSFRRLAKEAPDRAAKWEPLLRDFPRDNLSADEGALLQAIQASLAEKESP